MTFSLHVDLSVLIISVACLGPVARIGTWVSRPERIFQQ
jgi:hypothetical protein